MPAVQLVVTGFGKFCGVEENPTQDLINWLATLPHSSFHAGTGQCIGIDTLEVSMKGVDSKLEQLREAMDLNTRPTDVVLWVHFGVADGAQEFRLEAVAYNEADFRCPDERGERPRHRPIDPSQPLGAELYTQLPLNSLQERLRQKGHHVAVSIDPGRFLCNYVYYRSLQQHQQQPTQPAPTAAKPDSSVHQNGSTQQQQEHGHSSEAAESSSMRPGTSLFVHVPAFVDISREQQRRFALDLLFEASCCAQALTLATAANLDGKASAAHGVQLTVYH